MNAHAEVVSLLNQLRDHAKVFSPKLQADFDSISDSIETLTKAYMAPTIADWSCYGLTLTQSRILDVLKARYGKPVAMEAILDAVYFNKPDGPPLHRTIDVHVCKMRKLFKKFGAPFQIETCIAMGYKLCDADRAFIRAGDHPYGAEYKAEAALQALKAA